MDEIGEDGLLRHRIPMPMALRIFLAIGSLFVVIATGELFRTVWPANDAGPFFLLLILGAWFVGIPIAWAWLFGPATLWTVGPGCIVIERKGLFGKARRDVFDRYDEFRFELVKRRELEGDPSWVVILATPDARRFETGEFHSRAAAERLQQRIEAAFARIEPLKPRPD